AGRLCRHGRRRGAQRIAAGYAPLRAPRRRGGNGGKRCGKTGPHGHRGADTRLLQTLPCSDGTVMQDSQASTPAHALASWPATYMRVVLASRPAGLPQPDNFRAEQASAPALDAGQVRVFNHYLSIDPYMVGRMYETRSYAASTGIGEIMPGETAGQVVESRHPGFAVGEYVVGPLGWQEQAVSDGQGLRRADTSRAPLQAYLGALGMTGVTAWYGMTQICRPEHGSTVVVSAAAGAVGGVAVQLAKARGCRVVGIAGGEAKCAYVTQVL